jgi:hypothetical protein
MVEILWSHVVCHQIISTFQWCRLCSDSYFIVRVSSYHIDFSVIHPFQCLSVSSNHFHSIEIKYAFHYAFLEIPVTGWAYIKTCPHAMQIQTTLTQHLFIYTQLTHYASENASLPAPRMERASIMPLSTANKDDHLFGADHVWKEVLGVSWHWCKWLRRLLYIDFINWWFHLQYCY